MTAIRVLLAEDHTTIREGLRLIISAQPDMEVIGEAGDGDAAVDAAARLRPDVVVMDVSMPHTSGLAATQRLAQCCPDVKVLTLTRYADDAFIQQLLRAGARGYVLKQSQPSELITGIRAVAAGGTYLDPAIAGKVARDYARRPGEPAGSTEALTGREEEVLRLVAWGYSNKEIASRLDVSVKTVETHKANAMHKVGARSRIDVVRLGLVRGWLQDS
ncbi:MAG TPA: response regulator transcription factor [Vicinamibacterales bacterium]|nr:response regulator transcription factor [Vicinamibacterales bacterium]